MTATWFHSPRCLRRAPLTARNSRLVSISIGRRRYLAAQRRDRTGDGCARRSRAANAAAGNRLRLGGSFLSGEEVFGQRTDFLCSVLHLRLSDSGGALRELVFVVFGITDSANCGPRRLRRPVAPQL